MQIKAADVPARVYFIFFPLYQGGHGTLHKHFYPSFSPFSITILNAFYGDFKPITAGTQKLILEENLLDQGCSM